MLKPLLLVALVIPAVTVAGRVQSAKPENVVVSAYNWYLAKNGDVLNSLDGAGQRAFIDKWCGENPTRAFVSAVNAFVKEMERQ